MFDWVFELIVDLRYVYVRLAAIENDHSNQKKILNCKDLTVSPINKPRVQPHSYKSDR